MAEPRDIELFGVNIRREIGAAFDGQLLYGTLIRRKPGPTNPDDINGPPLPGPEEIYQFQGTKTSRIEPEGPNNTARETVVVTIIADLVVGQTGFEPGTGEVINDWDSDFDSDFGGEVSMGRAYTPIDTIPEVQDVVRFVGESTEYRLLSLDAGSSGAAYKFQTEPSRR